MDSIQSDLMALLVSEPNDIRLFSRAEAENIAALVREKFGNPRAKSDPLWETLNESRTYHGEEANTQVKQRLKDLPGPLLFLIDDWHGYSALRIPTGAQLWSLLERSYRFRWYVTDLEMTFVLCKNDHDMLIFCER